MLSRLIALIKKEFLSLLQDKKSRFILVFPPLVQLLLFAYAATLDVNHARIGILNQDEGKLSQELIERFQGSPTFSSLFFLRSAQELQQALDTQEVLAVLQFNSRFSSDLLSQKPASIQVILDGRKSNTTQVVLGYMNSIVGQFNADLAKKEGIPPPRLSLIPRNWFNPNLIYAWFTVPGLIATLSMMTSLIVTAMSVARERELGTFDQLLVSPLNSWEILVGKMIPGLLVGIFQATLMVLASLYLFSVPLTGSLALLYGSLLFFIASSVGIGLFLSSISLTQQQALLYAFVFLAPAITLSGFATPVENMPLFLQKFTDINPLKHFLLICRGVFLKQWTMQEVWQHTYPLMIISTVNLCAATWLFKKRTL